MDHPLVGVVNDDKPRRSLEKTESVENMKGMPREYQQPLVGLEANKNDCREDERDGTQMNKVDQKEKQADEEVDEEEDDEHHFGAAFRHYTDIVMNLSPNERSQAVIKIFRYVYTKLD